MSITEKHYTSGDYWKNRGHEDSAYKADLALNALACANIELRQGLRAVEIGSGSGGFILPLAERLNARFCDFSLSGYDIAPNAVELAKRATQDERIKFSILHRSWSYIFP
jgi:methylase of polypeptide subunit release factors